MQEITEILENPTPYRWAIEAAGGAAFGAAYRYSKCLDDREDRIKHEKEATSVGIGVVAETGDYLRNMAGKNTLFGPEDWAIISGSAYAAQRKVDDYLED